MVGVLIGSVSGGQMADSIGRKPTLFTGISTMILFNFVGYFTQSWKVYSVFRFFIGIGVGIWFTVNFPQMIEFVPPSWRPLVVCIPSEPFASMLYALISWWLHDWRRIHLLKTVIGMIFLIILWFVPESFRWLVSKKKFECAKRSIGFVAYVNRVPKPDLKELFDSASTQNTTSNTTSVYSVATLWTLKQLRNVTLPLSVLWFAINTAWFSMALGMESISVDIYLTIFLINLVDFPAYLTGPLVNRFGRRKYCFFVYGMSSILACVSGILQHFERLSMSSMSFKLATLDISLLTKMTVTTAVTALIVYTMELYPTVLRTIGYGFQSTFGRLGAIAASLLICLDGIFPGSLYFSSGVLIFLSIGVLVRLKETKNDLLPDCI